MIVHQNSTGHAGISVFHILGTDIRTCGAGEIVTIYIGNSALIGDSKPVGVSLTGDLNDITCLQGSKLRGFGSGHFTDVHSLCGFQISVFFPDDITVIIGIGADCLSGGNGNQTEQ